MRSGFPAAPPGEQVAFDEVMTQLDSVVVPGVTQVQHPMHFGWFPSNASLASVLGDIASTGIGSLGITWQSSPALTEVEEVMCDWLRQLCGLSDDVARRHPGHRLDGLSRRDALRSRARQRLPAEPWRPAGRAAAAGGLRLAAVPLVGAEGRAARRLRRRQPAPCRDRPGHVRAPPRKRCAPRWRPTSPPAASPPR